MSAFLQSGRFYPGETPIFRVRFRPQADIAVEALEPFCRVLLTALDSNSMRCYELDVGHVAEI